MDITKTEWLHIEEYKNSFKETQRKLEIIVLLEVLLKMVEEDGEGIYLTKYIKAYIWNNTNEDWEGVKISNLLSETSILSGNLKPSAKPRKCFLLNTESIIAELNLRRKIQITNNSKLISLTSLEIKFAEILGKLAQEKDTWDPKEIMEHMHTYEEFKDFTKHKIGKLMKKMGHTSKPQRTGTTIKRIYKITLKSINNKLLSYNVTALQCNLVT